MKAARRAGRAAVESLAAGLVVGVIEAVWVARGLGGVGATLTTAWLTIGLCCAGALVVGPLLLGAGALAGAAAPIAAWRRGWSEGGGARVAAVVHALVAVVAVAVFAAITWRVAAWTHGRFHSASAIAVLEAALLGGAAVVVLLVAIDAGRRLGHRARSWERPGRWLDGRRGTAIAAGGVAAALLGALIAGRLAVPAADWSAPTAALGFAGALAAVHAWGARWPRVPVPVRIGAVALVVASFAVIPVLPRSAAGRAAVVGRGIASEQVLRALWALADRDGDGYPAAWIGGADCDDGDRARHPAAADVLGNGIDENCSGADLVEADLAHRRGPRPTAYPGAPRHNVVLISIDALRPDHLGAWGYARATSPAIDALAAGSARFTWALTSSPITRRAIPTLMTGRYPSALPWTKGSTRIDRSVTLLAELLDGAGWDTAAISCCQRLFGEESGGVLDGIDHLDVSADAIRKSRAERYNGDAIADRVIAWLETRRGATRPFFLWTHFIDPHHPYHQLPGAPVFGDRDADRYDAEIAFVDAQVGRILAALRAGGLEGSTIVIITADHGEELGEHRQRFHGRSLYNQGTRIPLVIHDPGAGARTIETPVSLADVMPTTIDLLGLEGPPGMNGISHAAAIRGQAPAVARPVLVESIPDQEIKRSLLAVYDSGWKLLWDRDADTWHLSSIIDDPAEEHDLAASRGEIVERLRETMRRTADLELTPLP